jgi:hypothetical protein
MGPRLREDDGFEGADQINEYAGAYASPLRSRLGLSVSSAGAGWGDVCDPAAGQSLTPASAVTLKTVIPAKAGTHITQP